MPEVPLLISIVDDDPSIRSSLSFLLQSAGYQVDDFNSAKEFLKSNINSSDSGCLILDVKMPGISGLDLQKELASINYSRPIIFITGQGDIPMTVQAMKNGAVNFLPKPYDDTQILDAVEEALVINMMVLVEQSELKIIQHKFDLLSNREQEVLKYLLSGMLNKQVGFELGITERTVKAHRKQVMDKMGIKTMAEAARLTEKIGIKPAN